MIAILIFARTHVNSERCFDNLVGKIEFKDIISVRKSRYECCAQLKDGSLIKTVPITTTAFGYKCDKAYIENGIDRKTIEQVIIPTLCMSSLPEEEQVEYFD